MPGFPTATSWLQQKYFASFLWCISQYRVYLYSFVFNFLKWNKICINTANKQTLHYVKNTDYQLHLLLVHIINKDRKLNTYLHLYKLVTLTVENTLCECESITTWWSIILSSILIVPTLGSLYYWTQVVFDSATPFDRFHNRTACFQTSISVFGWSGTSQNSSSGSPHNSRLNKWQKH